MVGTRLEKVGQAWRRVKPCLLGFLVVLVVAEAILDENTVLPDYLQEQPPAAKGPEGNDEE